MVFSRSDGLKETVPSFVEFNATQSSIAILHKFWIVLRDLLSVSLCKAANRRLTLLELIAKS